MHESVYFHTALDGKKIVDDMNCNPHDTIEQHAIELVSSLGKEHLFVANCLSDIDKKNAVVAVVAAVVVVVVVVVAVVVVLGSCTVLWPQVFSAATNAHVPWVIGSYGPAVVVDQGRLHL